MLLRWMTMRGGGVAACAAALAACVAPSAMAAGPGTPILTPAQVPHPAAPVHARHPFRPKDPAAYAEQKRQAAGGALAGPLAAPDFRSPAPAAVVSGSLNQPGLAASDNAPRNDGTPPDPTGAVGPSHYVEFVNSVVRVYEKNLTTTDSTAQLDTFIGATNNAVFDPQIQYDPVAGRWFYLADDCSLSDCSSGNFLAFGWSKSSDPSDLTSGWCNYFIRTDSGSNGFFDDYPKLGHNDTHLVFGTNVFNLAGNFVSSRIWTVPKPAAGTITTCAASAGTAHYFSGSAASPVKDGNLTSSPLRTSDNNVAFTPVPANTQDSSSNAYVVAADDPPNATQLMTWHVSGAAGSEALTADGNVTVSSFSAPANVPQPGTTDVLDSSDTRLTQAVAHTDPDAGAEAIWTQHTIAGTGGRSVVRWYELIPGSTSPRQQGAISNASSFVFNGAISPTMAGNQAVIQYNVGGSTQLAQIRASSRVAGNTLGSMSAEVLLGTSAAADQDFSCPSNDPTAPSCRWGDYAGASPDPSNSALVWGTNQLMGSPSADNPHWTTRNFGLSTAPGPVASFTVSPNPAFAAQTVTLDGSASTAPGGTIDDYAWDLNGDGIFETDTGTTAQVTTTYNSPQTVNVGLRVTAGGLTDTTTRSLTVVSNAPTASFTVSPATTTRAAAVTFDGSASRDAEAPGGIASYAWDFDGDGTTDQTTTAPTTTHSYGALGSFNARLIVTDSDNGASSTPASHTVTVQNVAPVAQLSFSPALPQTGDAVTFSAAGSSDPDGSIVTYRWDLDGDGVFETVTAQPTTTRSYSTAGNFAVKVQAQDNDGAVSTATATVPVTAAGAPPPSGGATTPTPTPLLKLVLTTAKSARLATILKSGLASSIRCGRSCTVKLTFRIAQSVARRTKAPRTVGKATIIITGSGSKRVKLHLTRTARARLRKATGKFTLTLTGTASDGAGHSSSAKRGITIKVTR